MRRRVVALGLLLGALVAVGFAFAGPASAHASVVASDPVDGSRLKAAPSVVTITFDESVGLGNIGYLHVTDQSGRRVDAGAAFHPNGVGSKIADNLKTGLGDGTYTASFRIISADSHPVAGTVRFVVGNGVLSASPVAGATVNHTTSVVFDIARWVSFFGFALLVGSWLILTVWPQGRDDRRARQVVWSGLGVAAFGCVAEVLLQGPYAAGTGPSGVGNWSLIDATLHTDYGQFHSARLLLLGIAGLFLGWALQGVERRSRAESGAVLVAGGVAFTFSAVGHAATTSPDWLSEGSDVLHISAMGAWLGGLVVLIVAVLPRHEPDELRVVLPVFSRVAFIAIVVLAVTGTYQAWRGVGTINALFTTTYGWLVVIKVVLFVGIVLLGNLSRQFLQRRQFENTERLRRSVLVEAVLAIGVLIATSVLVAQPRGKEALAIAHQHARSAVASLGDGRTVEVTMDPGTHGNITTTIELSAGAQPVQVTATATLPAKELGPIPLNLTANGRDIYGSSGVDLPVAGNWVIAIVVTLSQFDATTTEVTIHLY